MRAAVPKLASSPLPPPPPPVPVGPPPHPHPTPGPDGQTVAQEPVMGKNRAVEGWGCVCGEGVCRVRPPPPSPPPNAAAQSCGGPAAGRPGAGGHLQAGQLEESRELWEDRSMLLALRPLLSARRPWVPWKIHRP